MFEKFEKSVEKIFTKPFKKTDSVKLVELVSALKNEMDNNTQSVSQQKDIAPNEFKIQMADSEYQKLNGWGINEVKNELNNELTKHASSQNYALLGKIKLDILNENSYKDGEFSISTSVKKGKVAPATSSTDTNPVVDIEGKKYVLTSDETIIGRGSDADIVIDNKNISRHHASIKKVDDKFIIEDLNSTNGTYVEGNKITKAYLLNGNQFSLGIVSCFFEHKE